MPEITAGMVKELRERTDAPMMECKKALAEAGGDLGRAEQILRIKLGNKASKTASRITAEGVVAAHIGRDGKSGALVEVNCETDFVARNQEFLDFAGALAELVTAQRPADVAGLSRLPLKGMMVEDARKALIGKIGENVAIRRFARMAAQGRLASYVHGGARIGVMVDVVGGDDTLAKDLAMHIAASKPVALTPAEVPADLMQKERDIAAAKAAQSGKPAGIVAKMVEGAAQKFIRDVTLLGQPFVKDERQSVGQLLTSRNAAVAAFALFVVGEGLEKKRDDFVAEVMAHVGQAT